MQQDQQPVVTKKKLTKQQKITLIVAGVLLVFGISVAAFTQSGKNTIVKNGVEATATSTGKYMQTRSGGKRSSTVYKAQYKFVDASGTTQFVYGEKRYESVDDIKEGREVTVKYLKDKPSDSVVTAGE